jgi:glucose/arabinose dehydrogenase
MDHNSVHLIGHSIFKIACISVLVFLNLIGVANIAGVISIAFATTSTPTIADSNLQVQTVATGLNLPTSMAFIGPNDILVLEKETGMVKRIKDGEVLPEPLLDVNVATESERGMLGIDVLKLTSNLYYVFLYYTKAQSSDGGTPIANQLVRYLLINHPALGPAQGRMVAPKLLLNLPATPGPNHNGGKVVVGSDRNVYTVLGDLNRQTQAQNFENGPSPDGTSGILRVKQHGKTVGAGILGSTHPLNKYFAYGIRNSFGLDFDPVTGRLWDTENGPESNDEINLVEPGFNSGWADIMGMAPDGFDFNNLVNFGGRGKYSNPEFVWTESVAPTAIEFLTSSKLGTQYQNDMFVGDFNNGRIYRFDLNPQRTDLVLSGVLTDKIANTDSETQSVIFGEGFGGVTDLKVGVGDGYLYVLSIRHGALYKILPESSTALNDKFNQGREQVEEDDNNELSNLLEYLGIPIADNDNNGNNMNNKYTSVCNKLADRIDRIEEQQNRGSIVEEQADELRQRIEAMQTNLACQ